MEIAKAEESLKAAELCYAQGCYNSSANRAYYAMFQAAQVALETSGFMQPEWSHAGLHATFANELTRRRKQFAPGLARDLTIVQELRHTADYRHHHLSARQATRALSKARELCILSKGASPMDEAVSRAARRTIVDKYLTEVSYLAKELCPAAQIEATTERYEDEDGHVRIYPPAGLSQRQIADLEGKIAERCIDILVETGVFLCTAVYEPYK